MYKRLSASLRAIICAALLLGSGTQSAIAEARKPPVMVPPAKILIKQRDFIRPNEWVMTSDQAWASATQWAHRRSFQAPDDFDKEASGWAIVFTTIEEAKAYYKSRTSAVPDNGGGDFISRPKPLLKVDQWTAVQYNTGAWSEYGLQAFYVRVGNVVIQTTYATNNADIQAVINGCEKIMIARIKNQAAGGKCGMTTVDF